MLERPESFNEVYGQTAVVKFLKSRIEANSLPQFIIFNGEEGLGKTTLAKICAVHLSCPEKCGTCERCANTIDLVIRKNKDTENVKSFKMSLDGGKDTVRELLAQYNTSFISSGCRVIIADEAQNMSKQAYDALLNDTEYPPEKVYLFLCTTDLGDIPKALRSRATILNLKRLARSEMVFLLSTYAGRHGLRIEMSDIAFDIIAAFAENKPRAALKVLEAMGENRSVSIAEIKEFIEFKEPTDLIPIIASFKDSMIDGINAILTLDIDDKTQYYLCDFLTECLKSRQGLPATRYDFKLVREVIVKVDETTLLKFLYEVSNIVKFTSSTLLAAYLRSNSSFSKLLHYNDEVLNAEQATRMQTEPVHRAVTASSNRNKAAVPTMEELLRSSTVYKDK